MTQQFRFEDATPVWTKQLEDYILYEYSEEAGPFRHVVVDEEDNCCSFGSWGMNRDEITADDCQAVISLMLVYQCQAAFSSFKSHLDMARAEEEEDEE
ncbi:MAG TPA: hypothetical protein VK203_27560 [Nostocaceae cyanobacterium]|nr:hypothetical protein [Nostocaceae cyanobacterium]